jgi:hypothetical protein
MELSAELSAEEVPLFWPGPSLRPDYPRFVANINDEVTLWADTTLRDFRVYPINSIGWAIVKNHEGFTILGAYGPTIHGVTESTRIGYDAVYRNREAILLYAAMLVPH